eukprot:1394991-Alexandrium_andersonii.AAC.1
MSASLVGSEMCIRDSIKPQARPRGALRGLRAQPQGALRAAHRPRVPGSVSYTHLTLPTICSV